MIPFFSKRNQVYGTFCHSLPAVEKHFIHLADWEKEIGFYELLECSDLCPKILHKAPGVLFTEYLPYPTLLAELERQERDGFSSAPWLALAQWLSRCHALTGHLPGEGNLRNFLWDASRNRVIGLDLESFEEASLDIFGAVLVAALLHYNPANTLVKMRAAVLLIEQLRVTTSALESARYTLQERREKLTAKPPITGIILAGGASSRMGQNKAELQLQGTSLLAWQTEKLRKLGITDILLSGQNCPVLPDTRVIPDVYPGRGPLSGLHACLKAAKNSSCLVLSVDVPMVPLSALSQLCRAHDSGATVLCHKGAVEPLIGIYDKNLSEAIEGLIQKGSAPVRALKDLTSWNTWEYLGPDALLHNCNTPQDFSYVSELVGRYTDHSLPI